MKRFLFLLAVALAAVVPAVLFRFLDWRPNPVVDTAVFGVAVLAAGFMLSWGAEAAEKRISQGLILALVALVTVLPEYAVDMYYAYQAGKAPASNYVHYAAANMTGANRLLVGVAWPLIALLHWWNSRQRAIALATVNLVEVGFLMLASLYAFVIVLRDRIGIEDSVVLLLIFSAYLWVAGRAPKVETGQDDDDEPGPAGALATLSPARQWVWMSGLTLVAALVILASAEPFAESIVASGRLLKVDEFLLIQWLAPLASEAPAVVIAVLFVLSNRAEGGLTTMISDKINQWTLLVGMLPLAMSVGAGGMTHLPLDARQHEEFFLTAAQSLFAVSLLLKLRFGIVSALTLAILFGIQVALAVYFRDDPARTIASLTALGWLYITLASGMFVLGVPSAWRDARQLGHAGAQRLRQQARLGSGDEDAKSRE